MKQGFDNSDSCYIHTLALACYPRRVRQRCTLKYVVSPMGCYSNIKLLKCLSDNLAYFPSMVEPIITLMFKNLVSFQSCCQFIKDVHC